MYIIIGYVHDFRQIVHNFYYCECEANLPTLCYFASIQLFIVVTLFSFGRIGRIVCRIGIRNGLDFLAINDPFIDPDYMVLYLVAYNYY